MNPTQIAQFRQAALSQGADPNEVDQYISQKTQNQPQEQSNPIGDFAGGLANTALGVGRAVGGVAKEAVDLLPHPGESQDQWNQRVGQSRQNDFFLTDQQKQGYSGDVGSGLMQGAKDIAGTESFLVPETGALKAAEGANVASKAGLFAARTGLQGAEQGGLYGFSQPGATPGSVAGSAATGALLNPAVRTAGKGIGALFGKGSVTPSGASSSPSLEDQFLARQLNLTPKEQTQSKVAEVVNYMKNRFGLTNPDDWQALHDSVSPELVSLREKAVGGAAPVDLGSYQDGGVSVPAIKDYAIQVFNDQVVDPSSKEAKGVLAVLDSIKPHPGNPAQNTNPEGLILGPNGERVSQGAASVTADQASVYKAIQNLGNKANSLSTEAARTGSSDAKHAAAAIYEIKNSLQDRLFQNSGADAQLQNGALQTAVDNIKNSGVKGADQVANELSQSKTLNQVNSIFHDLIKANTISEISSGRAGGVGEGITRGLLTAVGATHGPIGAVVANAASPLISTAGKYIGNPVLRGAASLVKSSPTVATGASAVPSFISKGANAVGAAAKQVAGPTALATGEGIFTPPPAASGESINSFADGETSKQRLNDWYSQVAPLAAADPYFKELTDRKFQAASNNIEQNQLVATIADAKKRLSSVGFTGGGPVDWVRRQTNPNYKSLLQDLEFINTVGAKNGATLGLTDTSSASEIQAALNQLQGILSASPATSNSPTPAFVGGGQ